MTEPTLEYLAAIIATFGAIIHNDDALLLIGYQRQYIAALEAELAALKPDALVMLSHEIVWPKSPLICHCEEFEGTDWECERCGGGRF